MPDAPFICATLGDFVVTRNPWAETVNRALERHSLFRRLGMFRGLTLALILSVPFWLILGIALAYWVIR